MKPGEDIKNAVRVLKDGGVILYPTDTIWGLGCDATSSSAVSRIFSIKKRSESKSLIVLVDSEQMLERYVREIPDAAAQIISVTDMPITIIYPRARNLAPEVIAEDGSVGIRITADKFCQGIIGMLKKPVVSTSANVSGEPFPENFASISNEILSAADYVAWHRREDRQKRRASPVIKVEVNGEIRIIRK